MNTQRGYSLMELAIVLVVISLLITGFTAGFSHYRDRAEYISAGRNSELDELVDELKKVPETAQAPDTTPEPVPDPPATPEPDVDTDDADDRPFWIRWLDWWRDSGRRDNRRSNR